MPLTSFGKFKMYAGFVIFVPIRVALLIPFMLVMVSLISLCLAGSPSTGPTGCRKKVFTFLIYVWMRGFLFLMGYYYVHVRGSKPDLSQHRRYVVIGNHSGWMDVAWLACQYAPSFVAKSSVKSIPVIGSIASACRTIFIDRLAAGGVTSQIVERLTGPDAGTGGEVSAIGMFPEGTTTNNTHIVNFRSGAFVAGVPVVPMIFRYRYWTFDPVFSSVNMKWHLLGTMAQFSSWMEVTYLPVYVPSDAEKQDPRLYAANVKKLMLANSHMQDSEATYDDKLKWEKEVGYENAEVYKNRIENEKNAKGNMGLAMTKV